MNYHEPVLLHESVEALSIRADGTYIDATFGGGGHSRQILQALGPQGQLIAFDQDAEAAANIPKDDRLTFVQNNFRHIKRFAKLYGVIEIDGILADLGVSSHQLDKAERGFSYRFDVLLDMRMNQEGERTASDILNVYDAERLQQILSTYGEVRNARTVALAIVSARTHRPIRTIGDFLGILDPLVRGNRQRYLSQVFQALRIEVNDELEALKEFLKASMNILRPNGRLVVITYHSLEDRLVKRFLKYGSFDNDWIKDDYGNIFRPFRLITKKAQIPTPEEITQNPRARSARLRIAEKQAITKT